MQTSLLNRKNQRMTVQVDEPNCPPRGVFFMAHGMAGYKEQPAIEAAKTAALYEGFMFVCADFTNAFGDADGDLDTLSMASHIADFEDVVAYIKEQPWFKHPFVIGGHSIGNLAALEYVHNVAGEGVDGVVAVSPNLSGKLRMKAFETYQPQAIVRMNERGYLNIKDPITGKHGRLMKDYIEDFLTCDVTAYAADYTTPMLFITGLDDVITPPENVRPFVWDAVNCHLTYHEIYGADHFWRTEGEKGTLNLHIEEWLQKLF